MNIYGKVPVCWWTIILCPIYIAPSWPWRCLPAPSWSLPIQVSLNIIWTTLIFFHSKWELCKWFRKKYFGSWLVPQSMLYRFGHQSHWNKRKLWFSSSFEAMPDLVLPQNIRNTRHHGGTWFLALPCPNYFLIWFVNKMLTV